MKKEVTKDCYLELINNKHCLLLLKYKSDIILTVDSNGLFIFSNDFENCKGKYEIIFSKKGNFKIYKINK